MPEGLFQEKQLRLARWRFNDAKPAEAAAVCRSIRERLLRERPELARLPKLQALITEIQAVCDLDDLERANQLVREAEYELAQQRGDFAGGEPSPAVISWWVSFLRTRIWEAEGDVEEALAKYEGELRIPAVHLQVRRLACRVKLEIPIRRDFDHWRMPWNRHWSPTTATLLKWLAIEAMDQGDFAQARDLLDRAAEMAAQYSRRCHLVTRFALAPLYLAEDQRGLAVSAFAEAAHAASAAGLVRPTRIAADALVERL